MISANDAKIANWVCAALSIVILLLRLGATRHRDKKFDIASYVVFASLAVLGARLAVVYLYLLYGTSNDVLNSKTRYFNASDLATLKAGSILALIARLLVTTYYWLQISLLLIFYSRLIRDIRWHAIAIKACWCTVAATYVAVVLTTFLECRPFRLYWQIDPNPGECVRAYAQVFTQGIANVVVDLFLLVISFPLLTVRNRSWNQTLRVGALFALGFFCIVIVCLRLAYVYGQGLQPVRSFWASIQTLVSTFVANAPTIYGCFKLVRRRKSEQLARRASRPEPWSPLADTPQMSRQQSSAAANLDLGEFQTGVGNEKAWSEHIP